MILLGFQPLLCSVKVRYFLLKSDGVLRLENRLPKRHGGSHTAAAEYITRSIVFAVSALRGDVGFNSYYVERLLQTLPRAAYPSSCAKNEAPILAVGAFIFAWNERILTPLCDSLSRRMGFAFEP